MSDDDEQLRIDQITLGNFGILPAYRLKELGEKMLSTAQKERLVRLVTQEADILIDDVRAGRFRKFSANYLREVVRCKHGEAFTNTVSPIVYDEVKRRRPDLKNWIDT